MLETLRLAESMAKKDNNYKDVLLESAKKLAVKNNFHEIRDFVCVVTYHILRNWDDEEYKIDEIRELFLDCLEPLKYDKIILNFSDFGYFTSEVLTKETKYDINTFILDLYGNNIFFNINLHFIDERVKTLYEL